MANGFPERTHAPRLHVDQGGSGDTVYLLVHGLSTTGAVWRDLAKIIEDTGAGRWIAPDLRGQGSSDWALSYGMGEQTMDVVPLIRDAERLIVIGHSKGGLVAMLLGSGWFGVNPAGVIVLGCKTTFTDEQFARVMAYAEKPARWFDSFDDAAERYMKASGLIGLVDPDDPRTARGVAEGPGGFRLAADPICTVPGGDAAPYYGAVRCPVVMATGSEDHIAPSEPMFDLHPETVVIEGAPHNVHVTHPKEVWDLVERLEEGIAKG